MLLSYAHALEFVSLPHGMDAHQVSAVLNLLMSGTLTHEQGASLLISWSRRGETGSELAVVVKALLDRAILIPVQTRCIDPVGTGGSGLTRYNISTTTAFILASAGVAVAKHGNRGSARPNGSFDFLEAIGVPFQLSPAALARLLQETGVCFLFARAMHPAMAAVAPYRKQAAATVKRTIFNLAGPLANPCRPVRQLLGVADPRTAKVVTEAMLALGTERTVVVCGHPGLDEVSVTGATQVWDVRHGAITQHTFESPFAHALAHSDLPGGDAPVNAEIFKRLLDGTERGPLFDMVLVNAGMALDCWSDRPLLGTTTGIEQARELIISGKVQQTVERHRALASALM